MTFNLYSNDVYYRVTTLNVSICSDLDRTVFHPVNSKPFVYLDESGNYDLAYSYGFDFHTLVIVFRFRYLPALFRQHYSVLVSRKNVCLVKRVVNGFLFDLSDVYDLVRLMVMGKRFRVLDQRFRHLRHYDFQVRNGFSF